MVELLKMSFAESFIMKKYSLIFFIAVHCSLFSMKRELENASNFFDFALLLPTEIQENIIYTFLSQDNPLFRSVIIRLVCTKWANIVMNKNGRINDLLKIAEEKNLQFLFMFKQAVEKRIKIDNTTFLNACLFNVRYKSAIYVKGSKYIMSYIIKEDNESLFLKAITRDNACLNQESIHLLIHKNEHKCTLDNNGMCSQRENFNKILKCLIKNKPAIFLKCKYDFFQRLIDSFFINSCMLKMILPYLEVHNSNNISYYLKVIVERQKEFLEKNKAGPIPFFIKIIPSTNSQNYLKESTAFMDERHYYYLSVLIKGGANLLVLTKSSDGEMVPLAATLIKEVDGDFFPKVKQLLENSIKVKQFLENSIKVKQFLENSIHN